MVTIGEQRHVSARPRHAATPSAPSTARPRHEVTAATLRVRPRGHASVPAMARPRHLACLLVAGLAACRSHDNAQPDSQSPLDAAPDADAAVPRVESAVCRFTVDARLGLHEGTDYTCGDLVVEE